MNDNESVNIYIYVHSNDYTDVYIGMVVHFFHRSSKYKINRNNSENL